MVKIYVKCQKIMEMYGMKTMSCIRKVHSDGRRGINILWCFLGSAMIILRQGQTYLTIGGILTYCQIVGSALHIVVQVCMFISSCVPSL